MRMDKHKEKLEECEREADELRELYGQTVRKHVELEEKVKKLQRE